MHVVIGIDLWLYLYFLCLYLAIFVCACLLCLSVCILLQYKRMALAEFNKSIDPMIGSQCVTGETKIWQGDSLPYFGY